MNALPAHQMITRARQIAVLRVLASLSRGRGHRGQLGGAVDHYNGPGAGRGLLTFAAGIEAVLLGALADGLVKKGKLHRPEGRQEYQITQKGRALLAR